MEFATAAFWLALAQIVWVNILLSGDNAVVIALAARSLPAKQQKQAIVIGSGAAIVMRIVLTVVAAQLLQLPWLKTIGAVLLLYIGVTLLLPDGEEDGHGAQTGGMVAAVRTILIADLVMSLDNVIAVAAAAKGSMPLLIIGLAISIPLVIFGSTLLLRVIERFPVVVWLGAALLGYIAGEIIVADPALAPAFAAVSSALGMDPHQLGLALGAAGALFVVVVGKLLLARRRAAAQSASSTT
jgi:YjbE family integral membrane protein